MIKKNKTLSVQIFLNLQNHPTFQSEERLANLARGRDCFVGLSILLSFHLDPEDSAREDMNSNVRITHTLRS